MIRLAAALALAAAPTVALAQADAPEPGDVPVQFYVIPDAVIEGRVTKPHGAHIDVLERPKHARLLKLKHNVLPKLRATRHAGVLR